MSATVIIPTTGDPLVRSAIESVLNQTHEDTHCYLICDGKDYYGKTKVIADSYLGNPKFHICFLPINVGSGGFYGHRVYAAFSHLIQTDYVLYLDQDNWFEKNHVETCIKAIESTGEKWAYSLRNIIEGDKIVCEDNCESLGHFNGFQHHNHVDTNCYCLKTEVAIPMASAWHGKWGQDRIYLINLFKFFGKGACTGENTVNYRLGGNEGSVTREFFEVGNKVMHEKYEGDFPWKKKI